MPYLLVLGPADVGCVGVGPSAGDVTQLTPQLCLHPAADGGRVGGACLQGDLLLLVLLTLQVLPVSLWEQQTRRQAYNKYSICLRHISSNKTIQRRSTLYMNILITKKKLLTVVK